MKSVKEMCAHSFINQIIFLVEALPTFCLYSKTLFGMNPTYSLRNEVSGLIAEWQPHPSTVKFAFPHFSHHFSSQRGWRRQKKGGKDKKNDKTEKRKGREKMRPGHL